MELEISRRQIALILAVELMVVVSVLVVFRVVQPRSLAALLASFEFISVGVLINVFALRWPKFYRSFCFWAAQFHLFFSSIPLLVFRVLYFNTGFDQVQIFGIPGPQFHFLAEKMYAILIFATVADLLRARKT